MSSSPTLPLSNAQILQQLASTLEQLGITQQVGAATINSLFFDPQNPKMINNDLLLESSFLGSQLPKDFLVSQTFNIPSQAAEAQIQAQAFAGLGAKQLHIDTAPGVALQAWYVKPEPGKSTILFSNGADGDFIKSEALMTQLKNQGYGILAYQFRGYGAEQGGSTGTPTEQGLYSDLKAVSDLLAHGSKQDGIVKTPYSHQVLMGYSLGGDVSAHVAANSLHHYQALVMIDAPKSLEDGLKAELQNTDPLAQQILAPFQAGVIAAEEKLKGVFDITKDVSHLHTPTLFVEGGQDKLALPELEKALFNSMKNPAKSYVLVPQADHETILSNASNSQAVGNKVDSFLSHLDYNRVVHDMATFCDKNDSFLHFNQLSENQPHQALLAFGGHHSA